MASCPLPITTPEALQILCQRRTTVTQGAISEATPRVALTDAPYRLTMARVVERAGVPVGSDVSARPAQGGAILRRERALLRCPRMQRGRRMPRAAWRSGRRSERVAREALPDLQAATARRNPRTLPFGGGTRRLGADPTLPLTRGDRSDIRQCVRRRHRSRANRPDAAAGEFRRSPHRLRTGSPSRARRCGKRPAHRNIECLSGGGPELSGRSTSLDVSRKPESDSILRTRLIRQAWVGRSTGLAGERKDRPPRRQIETNDSLRGSDGCAGGDGRYLRRPDPAPSVLPMRMLSWSIDT